LLAFCPAPGFVMGDTDKSDPNLYDGKIQGGKTILKWRNDILSDWAERWNWLRENE